MRAGLIGQNRGIVSAPLMTVDEFIACRFDLPESGQWAELEAGVPVYFQPPDLEHGTTILNLSKAFAEHVSREEEGYACFDLGLRMSVDPDTVRFPAVSYFRGEDRFAETDRQVTASVPQLVVELASSADRRRQMESRISSYLEWGVIVAWAIDPFAQCVAVFERKGSVQTMTADEILTGQPILEQFRLPVANLFVEPRWWRG